MTPVQIARIAHEAVRAYEHSLNDHTTPVFDELEEGNQEWYIQAVAETQTKRLMTPALLSATYTLTPFEELSAEEQMKVLIVFEVARACSTTVTGSSLKDEGTTEEVSKWFDLDTFIGPTEPTLDWAGEDIDGMVNISTTEIQAIDDTNWLPTTEQLANGGEEE